MPRLLVVATVCALLLGCQQPAPSRPQGEGTGGRPRTGGAGGAAGMGGMGEGGAGAGGNGGGGGGAGGGGGDAGAAETDGAEVGPVAAECATQATSLLCDPRRAMPRTIKETGLFPAAPDFAQRSPRLREFVPDPPLWSDGMEKQRFLLLPVGTKVDNRDREDWKFPIGTIMVKTFFDDGAPGGKTRPIETRFIRASDPATTGGHEYFVYQWNPDGTDATLVVDDLKVDDPSKELPVMITIKRTVGGQPFMINGGQPFVHMLPSRTGCGDCHAENAMRGDNAMKGQTFIGFDEVRLNSKFAPASARTQLEELAAEGVFLAPLPAQPATIVDTRNDGGRMQRIKRFIFGNCVHCHWGGGQADFRPAVFEQATVGVPVPRTQSVKPPPGYLRVAPRDPTRSVVYRQVLRTMLPPPVTENGQDYRLRPMPPIGVADVAPDAASLADLRAWIMSLPAP